MSFQGCVCVCVCLCMWMMGRKILIEFPWAFRTLVAGAFETPSWSLIMIVRETLEIPFDETCEISKSNVTNVIHELIFSSHFIQLTYYFSISQFPSYSSVISACKFYQL